MAEKLFHCNENTPSFKSRVRISEISEVLQDKLYLSNQWAASTENITRLGITLVVRALVSGSPLEIDGVEIECIKIDDIEDDASMLADSFHSIADKIELTLSSGGKVLVHCKAGISRSASLVLAYLMKYTNQRLKDAYSYLKAKRSFIRPNLAFWPKLIKFENELFGETTVKMIKWRSESDVLIPDILQKEYESLL